jgi:hypothetical protein
MKLFFIKIKIKATIQMKYSKMPVQLTRILNKVNIFANKQSPPPRRMPAQEECKIKIITDEPLAEKIKAVLDFDIYSDNLADIIKNSKPRFSIGIFGGWGTGKTTLMMMIKKRLESDAEILSVWFDAWRYEREKYLAVIPFLRQIRIELENDFKNNKKSKQWNAVKTGVGRTFSAFVESTQLTVGSGSPVSVQTDLGTVMNSLKSSGSVQMDGERVYFHEHVSDYLKAALKDIRGNSGNSARRIVVFIDDLDRCTPEKALEVLESVKSFFDIEGMVYVLGMNYNSIDSIIDQKYGTNDDTKKIKITGYDYMEKIVQLPFHMPSWNESDILSFIGSIAADKELIGKELSDVFSDPHYINLLVKGIKLNPRGVKMFINNIILANSVFKDPENKSPDEKLRLTQLLVVQALNFRRDWNMFSEFILADDKARKNFLEEFKKAKDKNIDEFKNQMSANYPLFRDFLNYNKSLFTEDDPLTLFLIDGALDILLGIDRMEPFRRALGRVTRTPSDEIRMDKEIPEEEVSKLLGLLQKNEVLEFNEEIDRLGKGLNRLNLRKAKLKDFNLDGANLRDVDLQYANLERAILRKARLEGANLRKADLGGANLEGANLEGANLRKAYFVDVETQGVIIDVDTRTHGIRLVRDEELVRDGELTYVKALQKINTDLRHKILEDNPKLQAHYK